MRHILTPEETARGHCLTFEDRRKGGRNVPKATRGGAHSATNIARLIELGAKYRLTSERARELAAISAQVRRARRAEKLITLALDKAPVMPMSKAYPDHEEYDPSLMGPVSARTVTTTDEWGHTRVVGGHGGEVGDLQDLGASLAPKLLAGEWESVDFARPPGAPPIPQPDPFTLSALKRFLPGPRSPLSLTRSQRAHVDIMRREGYLAVTGDSMLALTEKGRQAIESDESSGAVS